MSERNHWITFANDFMVRWGAWLRAPRGDATPLIDFGTAVVELGRRHGVYDPVRLPGTVPFVASRQGFADYLRDQVRQHGRIPLFPIEARPGEDLWTPARLAFYRGDSIVEEDIGDLGGLLRTLRPECLETCLMFMRAASPLVLSGAAVAVGSEQEVRIQVRLDSDIWLPRVMGMLEEIPDDLDDRPMCDNRALAEHHTPRLNAFLADVRRLTLDLGGRWERLETDPVAADYADLWDETGIRL